MRATDTVGAVCSTPRPCQGSPAHSRGRSPRIMYSIARDPRGVEDGASMSRVANPRTQGIQPLQGWSCDHYYRRGLHPRLFIVDTEGVPRKLFWTAVVSRKTGGDILLLVLVLEKNSLPQTILYKMHLRCSFFSSSPPNCTLYIVNCN